MKKISLLLVLSFLASFLLGCSEKEKKTIYKEGPQPPLTDVTGLRIASWNLQWFPGKKSNGGTDEDQKNHISAIINELSSINADILLLQEIRDPAALKEVKEQLPNYNLEIVSNFRGNLEVAILTKEPLRATDGFMEEFIQGEEVDPPRGFAYATIPLDGETVLAVYSVHLKSNYGGIEETTPKREESARQLISHSKGLEKRFEAEGKKLISLIGGDFNSDPTDDKWIDDNTLNILIEAGFVWTGQGTAQQERISWLSDGRYPDAVFDHILITNADGFKFSPSQTYKTSREVSDHRPVIVVLQNNKQLD